MPASTNRILDTLNQIEDAMMERIVEGQDELSIKARKLSLWLKIDKASNLANKRLGDAIDGSFISIPNVLASSFNNEPIGIKIVSSQQNPFWWQNAENIINSHAISLILENKAEQKEITTFSSPIDLYIKVDDLKLEDVDGIFDIPVDSDGSLKYEDALSITRFDLPKGHTIFLNFSATADTSLKVMITQNEIPSFQNVDKQGTIIPKENTPKPYFVSTDEVAEENDAWFFVALLPYDVKITALPYEHISINYSFKAFTSRCQYWNKKKQIWSYDGCHVGSDTSATLIHCRCTHSSFFTGSIFAPPNNLRAIHEVSFFLSILHNANMVIFISALLLMFIFLMILARIMDKRDILQRNVIVLGDNSVNDRYAYLLTIHTGSKRNAGTTSTVGIKLEGTISESKPHLLISENKSVFSTGTRDWFIILTPERLGDIKEINLWHNNSGHRSPWYCNTIVVRDIQTKTRWVFVVDRWLSLIKGEGTAYCCVQPATGDKLKSKRKMFFQNTIQNFRESHLWLSILTRNPRSFYTRCQRVGVLISSMTCAMFLNILFYGIPTGTPADQFDSGNFQLNLSNLALGFTCAFLSLPVIFLLTFLFRKSPSGTDCVKVPLQRRGNNVPLKIYSDVETERGFSTPQTVLFYSLPVDPICHSQLLLKDKVMKQQTYSSQIAHKDRMSNSLKQNSNIHTSKRNIKEENIFVPFSLPHWSKYLAWVICIVISILATVLIIIFGLYFGTAKSYQWMTSVSFVIFFSALIVEPIKVFTTAFTLTFILKIHPIDIELDRGFPLEPVFENRLADDELLLLRNKEEYRPISKKNIALLREKEQERLRLHGMCIDLLIFVIYAIILLWLVSANRNSLGFRSTDNVQTMFVKAGYHGISLHSINDTEGMISYLNDTFVPTIHELYFYGNNTVEGTGWTSDYNAKLLGVPRLRQLRVKPDTICHPNIPIMQHLACISEYSTSTEDRSDYGVNWQPKGNTKSFPERGKIPWKYQTPWETRSRNLRGEFAKYSAGGYIANLGRTMNNTRIVLEFLVKNNWFDDFTRFIAIEFTLYNANVRLFNVVTLIIEKNSLGYIKTSESIQTVTLLYELNSTQINLLFALIFFIIFVCIFVWQQIASIQRISFREHFSEIWNIVDIMIAILAIFCIGIFFLRNSYVSRLLHNLEDAAFNEFVSFYGACSVDTALTYFMAILVCITTFRVWRLLRFSTHFHIFERALIISVKPLAGVIFMSFVILGGLSGFAYIAFRCSLHAFHEPLTSFLTLVYMTIGYNTEIDFLDLSQADRIIGPIFYVIFSMIIIIYLLNMFMTIIMEYYALAQETIEKKKHPYNLYNYMQDELLYYFKWYPKLSKINQQRLRGGADRAEKRHYNYSSLYQKILEQKTRKDKHELKYILKNIALKKSMHSIPKHKTTQNLKTILASTVIDTYQKKLKSPHWSPIQSNMSCSTRRKSNEALNIQLDTLTDNLNKLEHLIILHKQKLTL